MKVIIEIDIPDLNDRIYRARKAQNRPMKDIHRGICDRSHWYALEAGRVATISLAKLRQIEERLGAPLVDIPRIE